LTAEAMAEDEKRRLDWQWSLGLHVRAEMIAMERRSRRFEISCQRVNFMRPFVC
jgi:hypothetical protein